MLLWARTMRDSDRIAESLLLGSVLAPAVLVWAGALAGALLVWFALMVAGLAMAGRGDDAPFRKPWEYGDPPATARRRH
jgi:hypothetical protein